MKDPAIFILQEDLKSLTILALNQVLEEKLPRGNITLTSKVKAVYWSPFRDGLAVVFESQNDSQLRFSRNRLPNNPDNDFNILAQSKYSFKLNYDEKVFALEWTN